jgi:hypothetical protein
MAKVKSMKQMQQFINKTIVNFGYIHCKCNNIFVQ